MSTTLSKWMTLFIAITIMFSPLLAYLDGLHREAVDQTLYQAMKKASVKGTFDSETIEEIKTTLMDDYNFAESSIVEITGTLGTVPRGGFIEARVTVKRTPIFVIDIFNQGAENYSRDFTIMSEYIQ